MSPRLKFAILVLLLIVAIFWIRSEKKSSPEDQLVVHLDAICAIAETHVDKPQRGVVKMFSYLGKNSPDMMKQFGASLVAIERIKDDRKHDDRARQVRDKLEKQALRCERPMDRFWSAVEADPEASRIAERGFTRFGRTLDILLGKRQAALPLDLGRLLGR